jgi:isoamylase
MTLTAPTEHFREYQWSVVIDTKEPRFIKEDQVFTGDQIIPVAARSMMVLMRLV